MRKFLQPKQSRLRARRPYYLPHSQVHYDRTVPIIMARCSAHAQKHKTAVISTSDLKSDVTVVLLDPGFLKDAQISAICVHLRQI